MIEVFLLMSLATVQPAQAEDVRPKEAVGAETSLTSRSLDVPDEFVPTVLPYINCVMAKDEVPVYSDGELIDLSDQPEDCSRLRSRAVRDGIELLRLQRIGRDKEDRKASVLQFLAEFDEYQATPPAPPGSIAGTQPPSGAILRQEYVPAYPDSYQSYFDCKLTGGQRSAFGDTKMVLISYDSLSEDYCDNELLEGQAKLEQSLKKSGMDLNPRQLASITDEVANLPAEGKFILQDVSTMFPDADRSKVIAAYFNCKLEEARALTNSGSSLARSSSLADPACIDAHKLATKKIAASLTADGVPDVERQRLVDSQLEQIERAAKEAAAEQ